jgi:hypothetical protein
MKYYCKHLPGRSAKNPKETMNRVVDLWAQVITPESPNLLNMKQDFRSLVPCLSGSNVLSSSQFSNIHHM